MLALEPTVKNDLDQEEEKSLIVTENYIIEQHNSTAGTTPVLSVMLCKVANHSHDNDMTDYIIIRQI